MVYLVELSMHTTAVFFEKFRNYSFKIEIKGHFMKSFELACALRKFLPQNIDNNQQIKIYLRMPLECCCFLKNGRKKTLQKYIHIGLDHLN